MHPVILQYWKYAPLKPVSALVPLKTLLLTPNSEKDAIGRRWETFEPHSDMLSE